MRRRVHLRPHHTVRDVEIVLAGVLPADSVELGSLETRPGPVLQLRDSEVDEFSSVPRRDPGEAIPKIRTADIQVDYFGFSSEAQVSSPVRLSKAMMVPCFGAPTSMMTQFL